MQPIDYWRERLNLPAYRLGEAAMYARVSPKTIADWEKQRNLKASVVNRREKKSGLSFLQLIEVAVVAAMREKGVKLQDIREARAYLSEQFSVKYPFAQIKFKADGVDILLDYVGSSSDMIKEKLLSANKKGQLIWSDVIYDRLQEFNYGVDGYVEVWKLNGIDSPIEISPRIAFGAPNIQGIATAAVKQRWADGYSIDDISDDLGIDAADVEHALQFEGMELDRERKSHWIN